MTETTPPLVGGDAHGDLPPKTQIPPRSPITNGTSTPPTSVPEVSAINLQVPGPLISSRSGTQEIEPTLGLVPLPPADSKDATTGLPSAGSQQPSEPRHSQDQQVRHQATVFLPELAEEIQRQAGFESTCTGSGLEGSNAEEEEDPLALDLIQRHDHQDFLQAPSAVCNFVDTSAQSNLVEKERRKFTSAEKGKGVDLASLSGQQSNQFKTSAESSPTPHWRIQQGECSTERVVESSKSPPFSTRSRPGIGEHRTWRHSPKLDRHKGTLLDNALWSDQVDEHGYQRVKPAYWWRHSREKSQLQQPKADEQRRQRYWAHVKGKCLNCFSTGHRVAECWFRTKCWRCLQSGHKAQSCPSWRDQFQKPSAEQRHQHHISPHTSPSLASRAFADSASRSSSYLKAASKAFTHGAEEDMEPHKKLTRKRTVWRKKGSKRVSFANPLVQILGEAPTANDFSCIMLPTQSFDSLTETDWWDPMRDEPLILPSLIRPSKESRIMGMLESAAGWLPVASPTGGDGDMLNSPHYNSNTQLDFSTRSVLPAENIELFCDTQRTTQEEAQPDNLQLQSQVGNDALEAETVSTPMQLKEIVEPSEVPPETELVLPPMDEEVAPRETPTTNMVNEESNNIDDMAIFLDFISCKPMTPLLHTPPRANPPLQSTDVRSETVTTQRKSSRLADKAKLNPGKDSIQLAQSVLISKLGELSPTDPGKEKANPDVHHFTKHIKNPLTNMTMEAIRVLVEKGNQPKSKKKKSRIAQTTTEEQVAQPV